MTKIEHLAHGEYNERGWAMKTKWMLLVAAFALTLAPMGSAQALTIDLLNAPLDNMLCAPGSPECPSFLDSDETYWHFVAVPNSPQQNLSTDFTSFTLNLGGTLVTFDNSLIIDNGLQTDNVFVMVPTGYSWKSLYESDSTATIDGGGMLRGEPTPVGFNLSHVCAPNQVPEPSTMLLLGSGLFGLGLMRRRRNN